MSKNVAVFVDVANIFYAAKAAGIDIDYVTLLKSATAGRDFVRAYAYTGLDPENENQRQFHSFLARNGYKVISKDIRKYGDGRIKANLDIELVVDMMKTARNLDIAVVVSGDGDFAPAIRAVQEQGVRVEVISFRGNTSSDLIDVADQFTDIAQIARVEKASVRSGRRVAAEGDLSMTEVPEKETEGAPRRRRGRTRDERAAEPVAVVPATLAGTGRGQANLVVLPGERLSRRGDDDEEAADLDEAAELVDMGDEAAADGSELGAASDNGRDALLDDGRRRRRRRGGRGRGRGRRGESEALAPMDADGDASGVAAGATGGDEDDEEFEDAQPTQPPRHAFGSVWDSQIGVPSAPTAPADRGDGGDDEDLDEPEVPEYLLAERRQRGQGQQGPGRGRMQRGRSAYQAALDKERYGSRGPQPSFGSGFGGGGNSSGGSTGARPGRDRGPDRGPDRGRDRGRGGRPQSGSRPMDRRPRSDDRQMAGLPEQRSSEPWSEVPPELEELLRAELARKSPAPEARTASEPQAPISQPADASAAATKPARRTRTTRSAAAPAASGSAAAETASDEPSGEPVKPKARATRTRTTKPAATSASEESASDAPTEAPAKPATRRRTTTKPATKPATKSTRAAKPAADEG